MTQDVRQWLAEIKTLQQKLAEVRQERDEAYVGAANWRKLYDTEAQQRRTEATLARQSIEALKAELQTLRQVPQPSKAEINGDTASHRSELQQQLARLEPSELQQCLVEAMLERDRLTQLLKAEQENHAQTRKGLTTALGDTVDLLTKERATRSGNDELPPPTGSSVSSLEGVKNPSLELPPVNQAQSLV